MASTALVAVAGGSTYRRYAKALMESAHEHFQPTERIATYIFEGEEHWPRGTMMRYHRLLEWLPYLSHMDFVYLIDADMLVVAAVGPEILPTNGGMTATKHPGFVGKPRAELPYETRPESAAYLWPQEGDTYYCGGFIGGARAAVAEFAETVCDIIDQDQAAGLVPIWHDESAINRILALDPPEVELDPGYCYPDADGYYVQHVWRDSYQRRIVAIDKSPDERQGR